MEIEKTNYKLDQRSESDSSQDEEETSLLDVQFGEKLKEKIIQLSKPIESSTDSNGYEKEFSYIEQKTAQEQHFGDYKSALLPTNKQKNRYSNVLPSEKTRVKLKNHSDEEGSDYINANFIDGLIPGSEKTYIAAQGPLPKTFPDFWRMIWETNCSVIVMLTRLVENGNRLKCDRYFPEPDIPLNAGDFRISLYDITETPELTTRDLKIEYKGEKRNVYQFQYTAWPDHGLPPSTQAFFKSNALNK